MRVAVVTGASGHLGNVLARELLSRGVEVRAVVEPGDPCVALQPLPVQRWQADICDAAGLEDAFARADVVFHVAGIVSITAGGIERMERVNVLGTAAVLDAARRASVPRVVYMGSVHALVEPKGGVLDERAGFDPATSRGAYGRSKAMACRRVQQAAAAGMEATLILPTGVVGPYDYRLSEMGQAMRAFAAGKLNWMVEGAYDFVDVRDVAKASIAAAERGRRGAAYLVAGERLTTRRWIALLARLTGGRESRFLSLRTAGTLARMAPLYEKVTGRRALLTRYAVETLGMPFTVDDALARQELGHAPRPIEQSLADAWRWMNEDPNSPLHRPELAPGPGRRLRPATLVARGAENTPR